MSDNMSLDPYESSMVFSATEDDTDAGDEQDDESDEEDDEWWVESLSSSPPPTSATPTSLARGNSSPSLSESLDTLDDLNDESGLGTTSTRPSVSPPPNNIILSSSPPEPTKNLPYCRNIERSTSNLSSEDTGVDVTIDRKVRRTLSSRRAREALLAAHQSNKFTNGEKKRDVNMCDQSTQTEDVTLISCESNETIVKPPAMRKKTPKNNNRNNPNTVIEEKFIANDPDFLFLQELEKLRPARGTPRGTVFEENNRNDFRRQVHGLTYSEPRLAQITLASHPHQQITHLCSSEMSLSPRIRRTSTLPVVSEHPSTPLPATTCYHRSNTIAAIPSTYSDGTKSVMIPNLIGPNDTVRESSAVIARPTHLDLKLSSSGSGVAKKMLPLSFPTSDSNIHQSSFNKFDLITKTGASPYNSLPSANRGVAYTSESQSSRQVNQSSTFPFLVSGLYSDFLPSSINNNNNNNYYSNHGDLTPTESCSTTSSSMSRSHLLLSMPPRPPTKATSTPALSLRGRPSVVYPTSTPTTTPSGESADILPVCRNTLLKFR